MNASLVLATLPPHPSAAENLEFILVGFTFVIVVLLILAGVTQGFGLLFKQAAPKKAAPAPAAAAPVAAPATPAPTQAASDNEVLTTVVIAAAVHAVIGDQPHRILSINPAQEGWAQEGRRQIFSSHSVR